MMFALVFVLIMFSISAVSAEFWECFGYEQEINYCNDVPVRYTVCDKEMGCVRCMYELSDNGCYYQGFINKCNHITPDCEIEGEVTVVPLEFFVYAPDKEVYDSRKVDFILETNKKASYYYVDNINGRGRERRICSNCYKFDKGVNFKDGFNDITIKAVAINGEEISETKQFYVDSKKPRISRTNPRRGFTNGDFEVQFKEENPIKVILNYGTEQDYKTSELDEQGIEENCYLNKKKYFCNMNVDLKDFDGEEISYMFKVVDIAGNSVEKGKDKIKVDKSFPKLNNPDSFWSQGVDRYNKYIYFNFDITEENLDEIVYTYLDRRGKLRQRRLCSRLKDGVCEKRISFRKGEYVLSIQIVDDAGNSIGVGPVEFSV